MCGITGVVWRQPAAPITPETLDRMTDVLAHRGPDGRGTRIERHADGGVALGHRRLAIIDLPGGGQPLPNEAETVWIVFNGEIYNYRELRRDLEAGGHRFRTESDTETIVHLYEQYGTGCLEHLRGMFAFALWDAPRRRLFLARDRMGQKPLVYRLEPDRLLFASEIKSLLQAPGVPREVDPAAIDDYLAYLYIPHPGTIFRGIHKLPPAHYAVYEQGRLHVERYWQPDLANESPLPPAELRQQLSERLHEAVRLRLRSDVPLGAFLSGGIDSTAIVGLMQDHLDRPVRTYTIGFPVAGYDESPYAEQAARHLGSEHHHYRVEPASIEILPQLAWHFDEPFADSSAIPTWFVSQITRRHVTVALTGDGGDELFAGYSRYPTVQALSAWDRLPRRLRRIAAGRWWNLLPAADRQGSLPRRWRLRMEALRQDRAERYEQWATLSTRSWRQALYTPEMRSRLGDHDAGRFVVEAYARSTRRDAGSQAMHADLQTYLPGDLLAKVDITSMAHGLECRSPFLDHRVVELAATIPYRYLTAGGGPKPLLTGTFPQYFPEAIRRREKMGFRVPLDEWFRESLSGIVRETLLSERALGRGYFERRGIEKLIDDHQQRRWNHGDRLWALLCLEQWHRTFLDAAHPPDQAPAAVAVADRETAVAGN